MMLYYQCQVGAEISFRQRELNRLFCKSTVHVTYTFLIATFTAKASAAVKTFATNVAEFVNVRSLAPALV